MVRVGYKQTEVGEIPEDWGVAPLDKVCSKITDGTHDTPKPVRQGVPYLTAIHVKPNFIDYDECYYLPLNVHNETFKRCNPQNNDVLMVNIGAGVATTALVNVDFEFSLKNVALLKPKKSELDGAYLNQYQLYRKDFIVNSLLSGGAQPFLSLGQISKIKLALPSNNSEQKAIAKALSDVDELIASLENLIAKKRNIKTSTMQQFLTGKKRLAGFGEGKGYKQTELGYIPEDWDVKPLGELLKIRHGKSQKDVIDINGEYPILATGGEIGRSREYLYSKPSVLIGRKGTIDIPYYMDTPFWTVDTLFYSEVLKKSDAKFLYYKFLFVDWYQYNEASGVPSLNAATIENIIQAVPNNREEQTSISNLLTDFDTDIERLEFRLSKTKAIKQGIMQELLTGRTRLPIREGSVA